MMSRALTYSSFSSFHQHALTRMPVVSLQIYIIFVKSLTFFFTIFGIASAQKPLFAVKLKHPLANYYVSKSKAAFFNFLTVKRIYYLCPP